MAALLYPQAISNALCIEERKQILIPIPPPLCGKERCGRHCAGEFGGGAGQPDAVGAEQEREQQHGGALKHERAQE